MQEIKTKLGADV